MNEDISHFIRERAAHITHCKCFIGVISEGTFWRLEFLINLSLAIFLDKNIYLVVKEGTPISRTLQKIAKLIVVVIGPDDITLALKKIIEEVNRGQSP